MSDKQEPDAAAVSCGNCRRALDERSDMPPESRTPCPACGSLTREVSLTLTAAVATASGIPPTVKVTVGGIDAERSPLAAEIRGQYNATLQWSKLEGDVWLLQVLDSNGTSIDGGIGDDPEAALLEVYARLIPPTSE